MRWLIFALGVVLTLAGAASIVSGAPYIRIEFGWTEVIAGATALVGGVVTLALGTILNVLLRIDGRIAETGLRSAAGMPMSLAGPDRSTPAQVSAVPDPGHEAPGPRQPAPGYEEVPDEPEPAQDLTRAARRWSAAGRPRPASADRPEREAAAELDATDARSWDGVSRLPDDGLAPSLAGLDPRSAAATASLGPGLRPASNPSFMPPARHAARSETEAPPVDAPTVVGRYESGGASYVLFSDGTIEVETETGTHRFESMQDLKVYIDRQDADPAA